MFIYVISFDSHNNLVRYFNLSWQRGCWTQWLLNSFLVPIHYLIILRQGKRKIMYSPQITGVLSSLTDPKELKDNWVAGELSFHKYCLRRNTDIGICHPKVLLTMVGVLSLRGRKVLQGLVSTCKETVQGQEVQRIQKQSQLAKTHEVLADVWDSVKANKYYNDYLEHQRNN